MSEAVATMPAAAANPTGVTAWRVYLAERFPVPVTLLLGVATAAAVAVVAQAPALRAGVPLLVDGHGIGGAFLMFLLLFHLRVFDEHKDFAQDAATRPDRPVQRGLITLRQLKIAGAITLALELAIAVTPGVRLGAWWLLPIGYSVLMLFEFFAPHWLAKRYGLYAISHSAITAAACLALVLRAGADISAELYVLLGLALASTFSIDVLRKTWMPSSEIEGVDSWSKLLGVRNAGALGGALLLIAGAGAGWLGWRTGGGYVWLGVVVVVSAWGLVEIKRFIARPSAKGEKQLQVVAGVHYLAVWLGLGVAAAIAHGVRLP